VAEDQGVTLMPLSSSQYEQPLSLPEPTAHGTTLPANALGTEDIKRAAANAGEMGVLSILRRTEAQVILGIEGKIEGNLGEVLERR